MFEKLKKNLAEWKQRKQEEKKERLLREAATRKERLIAAGIKRADDLKDKGELIGAKPEGIALTLSEKDFNSYISCIFLTVSGLIGQRNNIIPGNRFQTEMSNGKTAIWSIMTKTKEQWKWETCHTVKAIFVGWAE